MYWIDYYNTVHMSCRININQFELGETKHYDSSECNDEYQYAPNENMNIEFGRKHN